MSFNKVRGFIYVVSNRSYKGMVKVGKARNPKMRLKQLSGATGVLYPFRLEACFKSPDYTADEARAHSLLRPYRVRTNKEFYRLTAPEAIAQLISLFGPPHYVKPEHRSRIEQYDQEAIRYEQTRLQMITESKARRSHELEEARILKAKRKIRFRLFVVALVISTIVCTAFYWS